MKKISLSALAFFLFVSLHPLWGQNRTEIPLAKGWHFTGGSVSGIKIDDTVRVPHTWNATDAQEGISYYRGEGVYEKKIIAPATWKGKRVFVRFEGVMTTARVYLNDTLLGRHRGGYSAFVFELTPQLKYGKENILRVVANNTYTPDVPPLVGDFNLYGGIYRPVKLIVAPRVCISPLDHASPGIYLIPMHVSESSAEIAVKADISNATGRKANRSLAITLLDAEGRRVQALKEMYNAPPGESTFSKNLTMRHPRLWNGREDPYLYHVKVDLLEDGRITDSETQPLGLRYFRVDPDSGFFLNGRHLTLRGVSRHQDRYNKGSALSYSDHKQDMDLILEMGANALRLAHYQQAADMYNLADSTGVIVWAEIPWVGAPGGFLSKTNGYEPTKAFQDNLKQQLTELIRQNFNHPSIIFWSIFNEIQVPEKESPVAFVKTLNKLAKSEDSSRLTAGASMLDPDKNIHNITDVIAWNRYYGWYYGKPSGIGKFLDKTHEDYPRLCIGLSEYGAGGSISQHTKKPAPPNPFGSPHPEEWQGYFHEEYLKAFSTRPYVWGTFAWNMFDFGSSIRREGDHYGINDKGLVTFDRKTKKDAFYLYKAHWSNQPVLHITSKRFLFRYDKTIDVKVYTNLKTITLTVNGNVIGSQSPENNMVVWKDIPLKPGNNGIRVEGVWNGKTLSDDCVQVLDTGSSMRKVSKIYGLLKHIYFILFVGLLLLVWLWVKGWRSRRRSVKWKRIPARVFFFIILTAEILLMVIKTLVILQTGT